MTTNEAAERLRSLLTALIAAQRTPSQYRMDYAALLQDEHEREVRRATVERIRKAAEPIADRSYLQRLRLTDLDAILDEEAAR